MIFYYKWLIDPDLRESDVIQYRNMINNLNTQYFYYDKHRISLSITCSKATPLHPISPFPALSLTYIHPPHRPLRCVRCRITAIPSFFYSPCTFIVDIFLNGSTCLV